MLINADTIVVFQDIAGCDICEFDVATVVNEQSGTGKLIEASGQIMVHSKSLMQPCCAAEIWHQVLEKLHLSIGEVPGPAPS
jgi:hypothetical protein